MTSRRRRFVFVFALTLVAMLGFGRAALAQSITIPNETSLPRLDKDGNSVNKRPLLTPEGVSLQDCIDDQQIRFPLSMSGFEANASIQVWASIGQDCKQQTARGGTVATCWRVYDSDIPLVAQTEVRIPVRKIMAGAPPFKPFEPKATEEACGKVNLANISVQFIYFPPGQGGANASIDKTVTITVDTVGPDPPSGLRALPADGSIRVEWTNISGGGAADSGTSTGGLTELTGVKVYCDPVSAVTTTTPAAPICHDEPLEAGPDADPDAAPETVQVCEDGGTTTSTSTSACGSANFVKADGSDLFPTAEFNSKYECGSFAGNTGSSALATSVGKNPLVNGTRYAVAVAATDRFGNVGRLSSPVCETPEVTTDFWSDYRNAGGGAGDGCTTSAGMPVGSTAAVGIGATVALSSMLRRRRRSKERLRGAGDEQSEGSRR
jgi:hypothetical protein